MYTEPISWCKKADAHSLSSKYAPTDYFFFQIVEFLLSWILRLDWFETSHIREFLCDYGFISDGQEFSPALEMRDSMLRSRDQIEVFL